MNFKVIPLTLREANAFVEEHHSHNKKVQGYKFAIGAQFQGKLVGVAIAGRPVSATLDNKKTIELLRSCVLSDAPKNTNSFLKTLALKTVMPIWGQQGPGITLKWFIMALNTV